MSWRIDDKQAQSFAMDWATRASNGKIANLARCYLRAVSDLNKALGVIKQRAALPEGGSERALLHSLGVEPNQFASKQSGAPLPATRIKEIHRTLDRLLLQDDLGGLTEARLRDELRQLGADPNYDPQAPNPLHD